MRNLIRVIVMNKDCFKEVLPTVKRQLPEEMEALARMRSTETAVVFQGRKRYAEAEEEE